MHFTARGSTKFNEGTLKMNPLSISMTNFLSLVTWLLRHGSRDNLVFPFCRALDVKNDNVDWLEEVANSALIISCFWNSQAIISDKRGLLNHTSPLTFFKGHLTLSDLTSDCNSSTARQLSKSSIGACSSSRATTTYSHGRRGKQEGPG